MAIIAEGADPIRPGSRETNALSRLRIATARRGSRRGDRSTPEVEKCSQIGRCAITKIKLTSTGTSCSLKDYATVG